MSANLHFSTLETNEINNMLPDTQNSKAINAMQLRLEDNRLKLLELDVAIRKTKNALGKAQSEIEAKKRGRQ